MKLADEHDKEFQQKYSTDLDTALIFVGHTKSSLQKSFSLTAARSVLGC
jgi:hypothetical protein